MKYSVLLPSLSLLCSALLGCEPRQSATLCLFAVPEEGADEPDSFTCDVDPTSEVTTPTTPKEVAEGDASATLVQCPDGPIAEKTAYFLRHDLPPGLSSIGKLKIHMETPCESAERDLEATHVDGRVLLSFTPPRGASCAFLLTTTMAQSELSCDVVRPAVEPNTPDPCADLVELCAE